jgi:hypothetical protein
MAIHSKVLVSAPGMKDSGCFQRYCLQFCAFPSCLQMNVYGTHIFTLRGEWVFTYKNCAISLYELGLK